MTKNVASPASHSRMPVGRPRSRLDGLAVIQTRMPINMFNYCKAIQSIAYPSLVEMFDDMLLRFASEKPWHAGLLWRQPRSTLRFKNFESSQTGWKQVNINLRKELKKRISEECEDLDISMSTYTYTAVYWWIKYVYPQKK